MKREAALQQSDSNSNENVTLKPDCIDVQEKKKKVVVLCSSAPQNVKFGLFT